LDVSEVIVEVVKGSIAASSFVEDWWSTLRRGRRHDGWITGRMGEGEVWGRGCG
jgi:hypothetical protein